MTVLTCPCCNGEVEVDTAEDGSVEMRIVRLTKPTVPWTPRGSHVLALRAVERVCAENGVTLAALRVRSHNHELGAIRRRAALAARDTGACGRTIATILHRNLSTVNKMAPAA